MHPIVERNQTPFTHEQVRFQRLVQQASVLMGAQTSACWHSWVSVALWPWLTRAPDDLQDKTEALGTFAARGKPEPVRSHRTSHGNVVYVKFR